MAAPTGALLRLRPLEDAVETLARRSRQISPLTKQNAPQEVKALVLELEQVLSDGIRGDAFFGFLEEAAKRIPRNAETHDVVERVCERDDLPPRDRQRLYLLYALSFAGSLQRMLQRCFRLTDLVEEHYEPTSIIRAPGFVDELVHITVFITRLKFSLDITALQLFADVTPGGNSLDGSSTERGVERRSTKTLDSCPGQGQEGEVEGDQPQASRTMKYGFNLKVDVRRGKRRLGSVATPPASITQPTLSLSDLKEAIQGGADPSPGIVDLPPPMVAREVQCSYETKDVCVGTEKETRRFSAEELQLWEERLMQETIRFERKEAALRKREKELAERISRTEQPNESRSAARNSDLGTGRQRYLDSSPRPSSPPIQYGRTSSRTSPVSTYEVSHARSEDTDGTLYVPPRNPSDLILTIVDGSEKGTAPAELAARRLSKQNGRCRDCMCLLTSTCERPVDKRSSSLREAFSKVVRQMKSPSGLNSDPPCDDSFLLCHYSGSVFCRVCFMGRSPDVPMAVIPAKLLRLWDVRRYPLCYAAHQYLASVWDDRIVSVPSDICQEQPRWEALVHLKLQIAAIKVAVEECPYDHTTLISRLPVAALGLAFSLSELETYSRTFHCAESTSSSVLDTLKNTRNELNTHVLSGCSACYSRTAGRCGLCSDSDVLFTFDLLRTTRCGVCGKVYHAECYNAMGCNCRRRLTDDPRGTSPALVEEGVHGCA